MRETSRHGQPNHAHAGTSIQHAFAGFCRNRRDEQHAVQAGAIDYITKPINAEIDTGKPRNHRPATPPTTGAPHSDAPLVEPVSRLAWFTLAQVVTILPNSLQTFSFGLVGPFAWDGFVTCTVVASFHGVWTVLLAGYVLKAISREQRDLEAGKLPAWGEGHTPMVGNGHPTD